jgi:hypothetical protein
LLSDARVIPTAIEHSGLEIGGLSDVSESKTGAVRGQASFLAAGRAEDGDLAICRPSAEATDQLS